MALACQFSELSQHNAGLVVFSPNSAFVASCVGSRCTVRSTVSLEVVQLFACVDKVERLEFSPDSEYLLCGLLDRCCVQVFCLADPKWKCRINEGVAGMVSCRWCPDSRHILTESDFGIQLAVWSLVDSQCALISYPKPTSISAFSDDGCYCAVGLRIDLQDYIGFYSVKAASTGGAGGSNSSTLSAGSSSTQRGGPSTGTSAAQWCELSKFKCRSNELASVQFVPHCHLIVAADSVIQYRVAVYLPTGEVVANYEAYTQALGVRCLTMHRGAVGGDGQEEELRTYEPPDEYALSKMTPQQIAATATKRSELELGMASRNTGSLLAIGSYDGKVRLMSLRSWEVVYAFSSSHPKELAAAVPEPGDDDDEGQGGKGRSAAPTMTVEVVGSSLLGGGLNSTYEDDLASDFVADSGAGASDKTASSTAGNTAFMNDINTRLSAMKSTRGASGAGGAGKSKEAAVGTAFVQRNLKVLPKSSSTEGVRNVKGGGLPKLGVNWTAFDSTDHRLLAVHDETYPRCLWIWDAYAVKLVTLLVLMEPIVCCRWRPKMATAATPRHGGKGEVAPPVLAICTGTSRVYFWTACAGASTGGVDGHSGSSAGSRGSGVTSWADLPTLTAASATTSSGTTPAAVTSLSSFGIISLKWSSDGVKLLLLGRESFCSCEVDYSHCTPLDTAGADTIEADLEAAAAAALNNSGSTLGLDDASAAMPDAASTTE